MDGLEELDDPRLDQAVFRYRLIAEALEAPCGERTAKLQEVAGQVHLLPDGGSLSVTLRTLQRWIKRYAEKKLLGLVRRRRKDAGHTRAITEQALERLIALRLEEPGRSTTTLIDIVERADEVARGALRRSTLDRHLDRRSASRRMLGTLGQKRHVKLHFDHPLDFVIGDFKAGPWVRTETDQLRRTELGSFIDHCSRFVPESRYGLAEDLMAVRLGLRSLCMTAGMPVRLYVDSGPGYQARRFHFACSQLDIDLVHSKAYVSEGRGGIERFNRTAKEGFELEVRLLKVPPTLEELNAFWRAWREERYHLVEHSETKEPPRERWERLLAETTVRHPDPVLLDEVLRLHARRKVHVKTSTVEVGAVPFVVTPSLRRRRVDVLWDPHDLSSVLIYFNGHRIERALPQRPGEAPVQAPPPAKRPPPSVDYLALIRRDHERRRLEQLSTLRFPRVADVSAPLTITRLSEQLARCTGRALGEVERTHATALLQALAPLEIALADTALKIAVAQLGHGLHASQYLQVLHDHVLAARQEGKVP